MRGFKKSSAILLLAVFMCCVIGKISVQATGIQPYWDNAKIVDVQLRISGSTAKSTLKDESVSLRTGTMATAVGNPFVRAGSAGISPGAVLLVPGSGSGRLRMVFCGTADSKEAECGGAGAGGISVCTAI